MRLAISLLLVVFSAACGIKAPPLPPMPSTPEQSEGQDHLNSPTSQASPRLSP